MELGDVIGTRLNEIKKTSDDVRLVFENTRTNRMYVLSFKGLLFETSAPTLNKRVRNVQLNDTLGFRATSQLRHLNKNPENYRQLFIQMVGSNEDHKLELLGALKNYKVVPLYGKVQRQGTIRKSTTGRVSIKKAVKKKK